MWGHSVELHQNWKIRGAVLGWLAFAVAAVLLAPGVSDRYYLLYVRGDWIAYAWAVVALALAGRAVIEVGRPLQAEFDAEGISWRKGARWVRVPWGRTVRITLEKPTNARKAARATLLTVWTADPVTDGPEPDVRLQGLVGYRAAALGWIREPMTEIESALRRYAGAHYQEVGR